MGMRMPEQRRQFRELCKLSGATLPRPARLAAHPAAAQPSMQAAAEERYLEAAFPEEYGSYKRRTPRLLYPFLL